MHGVLSWEKNSQNSHKSGAVLPSWTDNKFEFLCLTDFVSLGDQIKQSKMCLPSQPILSTLKEDKLGTKQALSASGKFGSKQRLRSLESFQGSWKQISSFWFAHEWELFVSHMKLGGNALHLIWIQTNAPKTFAVFTIANTKSLHLSTPWKMLQWKWTVQTGPMNCKWLPRARRQFWGIEHWKCHKIARQGSPVTPAADYNCTEKSKHKSWPSCLLIWLRYMYADSSQRGPFPRSKLALLWI